MSFITNLPLQLRLAYSSLKQDFFTLISFEDKTTVKNSSFDSQMSGVRSKRLWNIFKRGVLMFSIKMFFLSFIALKLVVVYSHNPSSHACFVHVRRFSYLSNIILDLKKVHSHQNFCRAVGLTSPIVLFVRIDAVDYCLHAHNTQIYSNPCTFSALTSSRLLISFSTAAMSSASPS